MSVVPELAALRREYRRAGLSEADLAPTWHEQFVRWLGEAVSSGLTEPNAVVFATATPQSVPSARTVLLKSHDPQGLVVFTNLGSRKAREVRANPNASMVFPWLDLQRQVVAVGTVAEIPREETETYFATRPRGSQIGAWVSHQSSVIRSRDELEERERELTERFAGEDVPVPPFWGGLRLSPVTVEFWQGRPNRLHDRLRYRRDGDEWVVERLSP